MFRFKARTLPLLIPGQSVYIEKLKALWREQAPFIIFALKSAGAAAISWQIAYSLLGIEGAFMAPVSAVIIVQMTSAQTAKKSIERVLGVLIGVTLSILTAHTLGVNIFTVLLMVMGAQLIGMFIKKKGGSYAAVQIPISAVLGLIVAYGDAGYPTFRLLGAIIGGIIGTIISMLFSPPIYISRARDALVELAAKMAGIVPALSDAIAGISGEKERQETYTKIYNIEQKVRSTERALSLGFDNARFNPWALNAKGHLADYSDVLFALNQIARQMRRTAFIINEPDTPWDVITRHQTWPGQYAQLARLIGDILGRTASYMSALAVQAGKSGFQGTNISAYRKENILFALSQAQQQLMDCETSIARQELPIVKETEDTVTIKENQLPGISDGYHIALQGTLLTDLRRMLNELDMIIAKLPPLNEPHEAADTEQ